MMPMWTSDNKNQSNTRDSAYCNSIDLTTTTTLSPTHLKKQQLD